MSPLYKSLKSCTTIKSKFASRRYKREIELARMAVQEAALRLPPPETTITATMISEYMTTYHFRVKFLNESVGHTPYQLRQQSRSRLERQTIRGLFGSEGAANSPPLANRGRMAGLTHLVSQCIESQGRLN